MRNTKNNFVMYVLAMTLLTILMVSPVNKALMSTEVKSNKETTVTEATSQYKLPLIVDISSTFSKYQNVAITPITPEHTNPAPVVEVVQPVVEKAKVSIYKVTSYMLNVREDSNANSKVLRTLNQNDDINVIESLETGWFKLEDGGFVNGIFTTLVTGNIVIAEVQTPKKSEPVVKVEAVSYAAPKQQTNGELISKASLLNVTEPSNLTSDQIEVILKGTALEGKGLGESFIKVEQEDGINAFFSIAVAKLESGNGTSRISKDKNNLFGLGAADGNEYGGAMGFKTKGDSVVAFGNIIHEFYLNKKLTTIDKIHGKYCPANPEWAGLVRGIMKSDYHKLE